MSDRHACRGALKTLGLAAGTALLAAARPAHAAAPEAGALCHGADGQVQSSSGKPLFPAL